MRIWRSGNPLSNLLVAALAVLAVVLVLELAAIQLATGGISMPVNAQPYSAAQAPQLAEVAGLETYQDTIDRSLFSWDRRPRSVAATGQPEQSEELSSRWRLTGIVSTGTETYAIFNRQDGSQQLRLGSGMYLEKWRIDEISAEQVSLSNNGEEQILRLDAAATRENNTPKRAGQSATKSKQQSLNNTNHMGGQQ